MYNKLNDDSLYNNLLHIVLHLAYYQRASFFSVTNPVYLYDENTKHLYNTIKLIILYKDKY